MNHLTPQQKAEQLESYRTHSIDGPDADPPEEPWDDETQDAIAWLEQAQLPQRFQQEPWLYSGDGGKLKRSLLAVAAHGPESGPARMAAERIRDLRNRFENEETPA